MKQIEPKDIWTNGEVKVGEYKKHVDIMDEYITTRPGPPTVAFK